MTVQPGDLAIWRVCECQWCIDAPAEYVLVMSTWETEHGTRAHVAVSGQTKLEIGWAEHMLPTGSTITENLIQTFLEMFTAGTPMLEAVSTLLAVNN